jgi:serine/threonine-protein kinase
VPRRAGVSGNTTASRVKSLFLYVQDHHGRAAADAFLKEARLDRDYLDDETRPLPLEVWHTALVAFASHWGRDEIAQTVESVVRAENLGVWTRVLRGASTPAAAFRQLDYHGGPEVLTERWQTLDEGPGFWRGKVRIRAGGAHERDGLCAVARAIELSALPLLFGMKPAVVNVVPHDHEAAEEEFLVQWAPPATEPAYLAGGAAAGAALFSAGSVVAGLQAPRVVLAALIGAAVGVAGGWMAIHDSRRRAQTRAQLIRIQALERAAALRDTLERGAIGFREGAVIAGQYRLGQKLGVGASGAIWEAERLADGEIVAIKLLRAAVAHDTVAADRLRREAAALGLAWHPNVVEVYDDGHLPDGTSYLVMERLYGESLATRLKNVGFLSPEETLPIALQVCDALGAVHAAGVVHRDLKPSNIFLAQPDARESTDDPARISLSSISTGERVKLLDFGVARVEWAETRLTNMDGPLGTPGYMSPEQEQGLEIDDRTDLFALGGVIHECLTGSPPPRAGEMWAGERARHASASGVQRSAGSVPTAWLAVIDRAMAPLPRDRYADARKMREALMALATKEPVPILGPGSSGEMLS